MNKERVIAMGIVSVLVFVGLLFAGATYGVFVIAGTAFFMLCILYAAWCEKI